MEGQDTAKREVIRLADLTRDEPAIRERTFKGAEIRGPAVIMIDTKTRCIECSFDVAGGERDELLWEIPEDRAQAIGAIPVLGCTFIECAFVWVGFAGRAEFLRLFRRDVLPS